MIPQTDRIVFYTVIKLYFKNCTFKLYFSSSENFFYLSLARCKNQSIDLQCALIGWFLYALSSFWKVSSNKLQKQPPEVLYKRRVLENCVKFSGKHLCQSLFFNKVEHLRTTSSEK